MTKSITVFTPTYNRAATLPRVYESLLKQSDNDFIWMIVDDGSTDHTSETVLQWKNEDKLKIDYFYRPHGGKHKAMEFGFSRFTTKYALSLDSDDFLKSDAIEIFNKEWFRIESTGLKDQIAEIRAFASDENGVLRGYGNYSMPENCESIDATWHQMVLKSENHREMIPCWNVLKLRECIDFSKYKWHTTEIRFLGEFILWSSIGRKYKTRYINKVLLTQFFDGEGSLLREIKDNGHYINIAVNSLYFLDENLDFYWWNPTYFFNLILKLIISGLIIKESPTEIFKTIGTMRLKLLYIFFFPIGFLAFLYFKFLKRTNYF